MAKVVIFGFLDFASLAHFYLRHDSQHEVVAFAVNQDYLPEESVFEGKPIVPFEEVEAHYSPETHHFFAPIGPKQMNRFREAIYQQVKSKGYQFISYISSKATVFPGAQIGENCFIFEDNTIQPFTPIGNNVILWSGNHIGHHGIIKDHVMFTSHVVLSGHCTVEPYSYFGVNATMRDGLHIAEGSFIAMGAVVTKDTEPWGIYMGAPAKRKEGASSEDLEL